MIGIGKLSVAGKLKASAIGVVFGFLVVSFAYYQAVQNHNHALELEHHETEFTALMGDLRVQVQSLRLNDRRFMMDGDEERINTHKNLVDGLEASIRELELEPVLIDKNEIIDEMRSTTSRYEEAFSEFEATFRDLGMSEKMGLHGKLREAVHGIEDLLKQYDNDALMRSMLMMRRHEKDYMARIKDKYVQKMEQQSTTFTQLLTSAVIYGGAKNSIEERMEVYQKTFADIVNGFRKKQTAMENLDTTEQEFDTLLNNLAEIAELTMEEQWLKALELDRSANWVFALALTAISIILLVLTIAVYFSIIRPLGIVERIATSYSKGNFDQVVPTNHHSEMGRIFEAQTRVKTNMSTRLKQAVVASEAVYARALELTRGNMELAERTEEQAVNLQQISKNMNDMTQTVRKTAEGASEANSLATGAQEHAVQGGEVSVEAQNAMDEISSASATMSDIISVIDDIAFQTNLLALNAAVEAARAGDQGRGFAVVATEVRNLAQRSAASAKEIKDLIDDIVKKVEDGTALVGKSAQSLSEIVGAVKQVSDLIGHIASSSQNQAKGIEDVNASITSMEEVTRLDSTQVEEAAVAARVLSDQAECLRDSVSVFKLDSGTVSTQVSVDKPVSGQTESVVERRSADRPWDGNTHEHNSTGSTIDNADKQFVAGRR